MKSRWFHYEKGQWSWKRTEGGLFTVDPTAEHIFGKGVAGGAGKRIGDMTREELMHVIAVGYHERDMMALEIVDLSQGKSIPEHALESAQRVAERYHQEAKEI